MTREDSQAPPRANPPVVDPARHRRGDGVIGFVFNSIRMGWRWLVRMRTALILLGVLALMTAVATAVPQYPNVPGTVEAWLAGDEGPGPGVTRFLRATGAFDVYGSAAFLALLLALFLSLTACLVPRIRAWIRLVRRSRPPLLRHRPDRPATVLRTAMDPDTAATHVAEELTGRRWRVRTDDDQTEPPPASERAGLTGVRQVAAEKGLWSREGGSLLFHVSFYVLLAAIVYGQLASFEGQRGVIEGEPGFADTEVSYWTYHPGRWFGGDQHDGWRLDLERFHIDWIRDPHAPGAGQPTTFRSEVTITPPDGGQPFAAQIEGNRPLNIDGTKIHQLDWGYAPFVEIEVDGQVVHAAFLTTVVADDGSFRGAAKAPAADPDVGLEIELFPFAPDGEDGLPRLSGAPWDTDPLLVYHQWRGDLQLGRTQQLITQLDTDRMDNTGWGFLRPGQQVELDGVTVRFVELRRWVGFQASARPQIPWLLLGASLLTVGLVFALYAYRRRYWVQLHPPGTDGRTLVVCHGTAFQRPESFDTELVRLGEQLARRLDAEIEPADRTYGSEPDQVGVR